MQDVFPKWLSTYPIVTYILALMVVSFMYSEYSLPWYYMLSGVVAVMVFFLYGSTAIKDTSLDKIRKESRFEKRIFLIAFIPRVLWMFLIYYIFIQSYGDAFGFENADALYYDNLGQYVKVLIDNGNFHFNDEISKWSGHDDIADMGYGIYVGVIYWIMGSNGIETSMGVGGDSGCVIMVRLLKCLLSSLTVVLIYRLTKRNFGVQVGRVAAILCALWPNFWYYCGCHLKEVEMVFLSVLFVEQADQMLRSRQFTAWKVIPVLLIAATIFTFRSSLAIVAILSLVFAVVMSSSRVVSWGKRIIVGGLALILIGVSMGNRIQEQAQEMVTLVQSGNQQTSIEEKTKSAHGNVFAKYAGSAVFAPLIFSVPFPTIVRPYEGQEVQQLLNGGNAIKSIMSCFVIFALIISLLSSKWRNYLLPLSFMSGYLLVLTMSAFAHSERFHQPAMPFEFMFVAYGLNIAVSKKKYKRWFTYWCGLMFIACIVWNWFKLAGRALV